MSIKLFNRLSEDEFLKGIFNAIPAFAFIVDRDVRLLYWNTMAEDLVGPHRKAVYVKRAGEVIHCVHSFESPEGCGKAEFCGTCVIRNSVTRAYKEGKVCRAFTRAELCSGDRINELYLLVTASPFSYQNSRFVFLLIENVSNVIAYEESQRQAVPHKAAVHQDASLLSKREREVLKWLKKGKSSWDISKIMAITERTVNYHIYNIIQKLDALNRTHAVAIAIEKGLILSVEKNGDISPPQPC